MCKSVNLLLTNIGVCRCIIQLRYCCHIVSLSLEGPQVVALRFLLQWEIYRGTTEEGIHTLLRMFVLGLSKPHEEPCYSLNSPSHWRSTPVSHVFAELATCVVGGSVTNLEYIFFAHIPWWCPNGKVIWVLEACESCEYPPRYVLHPSLRHVYDCWFERFSLPNAHPLNFVSGQTLAYTRNGIPLIQQQPLSQGSVQIGMGTSLVFASPAISGRYKLLLSNSTTTYSSAPLVPICSPGL